MHEAAIYDTWLISEADESPHLSLGKVKGELYIACAEIDDCRSRAIEGRGAARRSGLS